MNKYTKIKSNSQTKKFKTEIKKFTSQKTLIVSNSLSKYQYNNLKKEYHFNSKIHQKNTDYNLLSLNNNISLSNKNKNLLGATKTTPNHCNKKLIENKSLYNIRNNKYQLDKFQKKKMMSNLNFNQKYNDLTNFQRSYSMKYSKNNLANLTNFEAKNNKNDISQITNNKIIKNLYKKENPPLKLYNNLNNKNSLTGKRNPSISKINKNYKYLQLISDDNNYNSKNLTFELKKKNNLEDTKLSIKNLYNINSINNFNHYNINNNCNNDYLNEKENKIYRLELKMQKLFSENKTNSKSKKYSIIKSIFEESINILNLDSAVKKFFKLIILKYHDVILSFSQENKILRESSVNLQNLNLNLDKKYLELDKKYKFLLKENVDYKNSLEKMQELHKIQINNNKDNNVKSEVINKELKAIDNNDIINNDTVDRNSKLEKLNRMNVDDLDSLYFKDKINVAECQNSKKNYQKVPKILLNHIKK